MDKNKLFKDFLKILFPKDKVLEFLIKTATIIVGLLVIILALTPFIIATARKESQWLLFYPAAIILYLVVIWSIHIWKIMKKAWNEAKEINNDY